MIDPKKELEEALRKALGQKNFASQRLVDKKALASRALIDKKRGFAALVEEPRVEAFGDYATSIPLKLAKELSKPPLEIAAIILENLELPKEFSKAEVAENGFINFSYSPEFLSMFLRELLNDPKILQPTIGEGKTVVTDSAHPNIAKPMGVHHLLSTVIGDALSRFLAYAGYKVIRDNYLGDWGTQFGKLIYAYKTWGDKEVVSKNPVPELLRLYVKFHDEVEKTPVLEEEGRKEFKKLEEGDEENRKLWKWIVDSSLREFQKIWDLLGVSFDVLHGESFYEEKMKPILETGMKKGVFVEGERGALICEFPEEGYSPAVVKKGDGATLYATRDLARIQYWEATWRPALMVNVVDSAQKLYFQQLFSMAKRLGLTTAQSVHVAFGRMRFPDKRMSTRKGNIVLLEEVIDEAITLARKIVEEKNPSLPFEEKDEIARQVGIGALKFAVLHQNRETDSTFTWEKMLSLEGESAPYLQYVCARCNGILRRASEASFIAQPGSLPSSEAHRSLEEMALMRLFPKFCEAIVNAVAAFQPNCLTRYLTKLAARFNVFYDKHPVLKAESKVREMRLALVRATHTILKTGLNLLGIEAPDRM